MFCLKILIQDDSWKDRIGFDGEILQIKVEEKSWCRQCHRLPICLLTSDLTSYHGVAIAEKLCSATDLTSYHTAVSAGLGRVNPVTRVSDIMGRRLDQ